jgi:hypothetical protein
MCGDPYHRQAACIREFPARIKQALIQFVQPTPAFCRQYQTVFLDKGKFSAWLKGVLIHHRANRIKTARAEGKVISSDPSKTTDDGGRFYRTASSHPRQTDDLEAIAGYLDVLKVWAPESGR